jgi:hypothetical protein
MTTSSCTRRPSACANRAQVEAHRRVEIDDVARARADDELLHVDVGRMQQAALLGRREHRKRVGRAGRAQVRAFERIDGDVDLWIGCASTRADAPTFSPM